VNHDAVVAEIQARARKRGVLSHYCGRSVTCLGDRGLPDLFLAGPHGACVLEVKMPGDKLDPGQLEWAYALRAAGIPHYVMGPAALTDGTLDQALDSYGWSGTAAEVIQASGETGYPARG
jgi:hypothetical protein